MISPMTPPGTKVVALRSWGNPWSTHIIAGRVYTLAKICEETFPTKSGTFGALLHECDHRPKLSGFFVEIIQAIPLRHLRRVDLPECVTRWLHEAPVDQSKERETVQ